MKRALCLLPLVVLAACSGKGNTGRKEVDPALVGTCTVDGVCSGAQVFGVNGFAPLIDRTKSAVVPTTPLYPPIGAGTADPGSRVLFDTDEHRAKACTALAGIERSSWHQDFEPAPDGTTGMAPFFSAYDDKTEGAWHVPGDASWYADIAGQRGFILPPGATVPLPPWGLPAQQYDNAPSCDGVPNQWVLHVKGGRFNYYGGGTEHPLSLDCTLGAQAEACSMMTDAVGDGRGDQALNASRYDGVAFWARRGPDGASGLMVNLQDKYTSDRLARTDTVTLQPGVGYCQRIKQCYPTCAEGSACVPMQLLNGDPADMKRCVPNGADPKQAIMEPSLQQQLFPPCEQSTCQPPGYDPDIDYNDTQCKPYNFTGLEENNWCFGDKPPAAPDERCGDGYVSNVSLSTDWTYYKLPFNRFQQVGFAKKAPQNDVLPKSLYSIAFLFSVGYTDFYVDNVTFYRNE